MHPGLQRDHRVPDRLLVRSIEGRVHRQPDAMPNGGTFTVHADNIAFRHEDGFPIVGDFVQLSLEDTGAGMSSEVLGRAFEPLFTTKPKGMGTGLGLPQVFAFCERAGGLATIDSAVGAGTSVRLYLPRAGAASVPAAVVKEEPAVPAEAHSLCVPSVVHVKRGFPSGTQPPWMHTEPTAQVPPAPQGATQ